jgi:hypothetical protein
MKRLVLTFAAAALLGVMAPAAALAKHHHHHHHGHHVAAHHAKVRRIGNLSPTTTTPTTSTTTPSKPATPTAAATVTSFSGGMLTITPTGGSPASGMVTSDTRLECISMSASSQTGDNDGDEAQTGDNDGDESASSMAGAHQHLEGDENGQGQDDNGQGDDEHGGDEGHLSMSSCTTAALTAGTGVLGAELTISGTGAEWEKVILLTP